MTQIPHPSNMTDPDQQQAHYLRHIAEQLARIGDVLEKSKQPTSVPRAHNLSERDKVRVYNLRQVTVQLARVADALTGGQDGTASAPPAARRGKPKPPE